MLLNRYLILEDGTVFKGSAFGSQNHSYGEVVFTTSMTGYVESVTDPSYRRQILVFAEPTISNYKISKEQMEASKVNVAGVITRDSHTTDNNGLGSEFSKFLSEYGVPGIDGIDTRSLILKLRRKGVMKGHISDVPEIPADWPDPMAGDVVAESIDTMKDSYENSSLPKMLLINVGIKRSLYREMCKYFRVITVDHHSDFSVIGNEYDVLFVSNGPGDPASPYLDQLVEYIRDRIGVVPVLGVCLGHQLISRAYGLKTVKMHFGHRGSNHAVTDGRKIWMTTHNHGYSVVNVENSGLDTRMWDVNDRTVEMVESKEDRVMSVQFHPEASPGPSDSTVVFRMFSDIVRKGWYE